MKIMQWWLHHKFYAHKESKLETISLSQINFHCRTVRAPTHAAPSALPSKTLSTHKLLHPLHCAQVHKWLWLPVVSITARLACVCLSPSSRVWLESAFIVLSFGLPWPALSPFKGVSEIAFQVTSSCLACVIVWPVFACPQSIRAVFFGRAGRVSLDSDRLCKGPRFVTG